MGTKPGKKRRRRGRTDPGIGFIRQMNWYHLTVPPKGFPGFLMAALPFLILAGLAWNVPGFWQIPAAAAVLVLLGVVLLKIDWPRSVKTSLAVSVVVGSVLAFTLSGTEVGPFVLPVLVLAWLLSFWRSRAMERDIRERDSWRGR